MKKHGIFLLFIISSFGFSVPQENNNPRKTIAIKQIESLKNGVLLIRLKTKQISIEKLRSQKEFLLADKIENEQWDFNHKIVLAFRENFGFCPVYFFYSVYSDSVAAGNLKNVVFLNDSLIEDPNIKVIETNFFTSDFDNIKGEINFSAIIIEDNKFNQLKKPFPYFARTWYVNNPRKWNPAISVSQLNFDLIKFYHSAGF